MQHSPYQSCSDRGWWWLLILGSADWCCWASRFWGFYHSASECSGSGSPTADAGIPGRWRQCRGSQKTCPHTYTHHPRTRVRYSHGIQYFICKIEIGCGWKYFYTLSLFLCNAKITLCIVRFKKRNILAVFVVCLGLTVILMFGTASSVTPMTTQYLQEGTQIASLCFNAKV